MICRYCGSDDGCKLNEFNIVVCPNCAKRMNTVIQVIRKNSRVVISTDMFTKAKLYKHCKKHKITITKFIEDCINEKCN